MTNKIFKIAVIVFFVILFFFLFFAKKECDAYVEKKNKSNQMCQAYLAYKVENNPENFDLKDLTSVFGKYQYDEKKDSYFFSIGGHPLGFISICVMEVKSSEGKIKKAHIFCH